MYTLEVLYIYVRNTAYCIDNTVYIKYVFSGDTVYILYIY